jgi:hypothetical protein
MASATSKVAPVKVSEKQGRASQKSVQKYYKTEVTTLGDGGVKRETYRTDANGNNTVKISEVTVDKDGKVTSDNTLSTATAGEKKALSDPNSQLRNSIRQQTADAAKEAKANSIDPGGDKASKVAGGESGNDADGDANDSQSKPATATDDGSAAEGTRDSFPNCRYPLDIGNLTMDVIKFDMFKYVPSGFAGGTQFGFNTGKRQNSDRSSIGSVVLPIPGGIADQNKCDWGSSSATALDIAKANFATSAIFEGLSEGVKTGLADIKKIFDNKEDSKSAIGLAIAAQVSGVDGLQQRVTGNVFNPNMELLFKGPALRPFSFKFKLTPRSADESKEVIKIIRFFKQGMAPIRSQSNLFLKSPHTFRIAYLHRGENGELHRGLNMFKEVALQGFGVNYTPNGNYATYSDGIPVGYEISMTFTELEPVFNDDYPTDNDASIGF